MAQFTNSSFNQLNKKSFSTSILSTFCKQWNQYPHRQQIDLNSLTQCFIHNNIDDEYFKNTKRKDFMSLLKQECGIKDAASLSLWNTFIIPSHPHQLQNDYISDSLGLQRLSELETENMSLRQQLLRCKQQNKFLLSSFRKLINMIKKKNSNDYPQEIKSTLEIQSDWEYDEDKKNIIFDTYLAENGPDSSSEENQP